MAIWTRFGRHVVGNLTTVSTSIRDFTTLLIGMYLVQRVSDERDDVNDVETFLKWEQVAGYARAIDGLARKQKVSFRGVEQVSRVLSENSDTFRFTVSADRGYQILGNQKTYGIWGLYTVPSRSSGLIDGDPPRLTHEALAFVETAYIQPLARAGFKDAGALVKALGQPSCTFYPKGKDEKLIAALGKLLRADKLTADECIFYDKHLVQGGLHDDTSGRQQRLAKLLESTITDPEFELNGRSIDDLVKRATKSEAGEDLVQRLERIRHCESLLAPASHLFLHLLTQPGTQVNAVVAGIAKAWGPRVPVDVQEFDRLAPEFGDALGDASAVDRWRAIANGLSAGSYETVVRELVVQNAWVMKARGSSVPWVEIQNETLHVRFQDEQSELPTRKQLATLWRFPYFLDSLRTVTAAVRGKAVP